MTCIAKSPVRSRFTDTSKQASGNIKQTAYVECGQNTSRLKVLVYESWRLFSVASRKSEKS